MNTIEVCFKCDGKILQFEDLCHCPRIGEQVKIMDDEIEGSIYLVNNVRWRIGSALTATVYMDKLCK